jgi:preprotein translocase subunit SecF
MATSYFLLITNGLNLGIDFSGGTIVQVKYNDTKIAPISQMREQLKNSGNPLFSNVSITEFGSPDEVVIRFKTSSTNIQQDYGDIVREELKGTGNYEIRRVDIVGPKVGNELQEKGLMALTLVLIAILIYISFRFEWRFAFASIFALIHDISIVLGALIIFNIEVNLDTLAALLTILGYSLNDTIIVFDRIREGLIKLKKVTKLDEIIDESITRTLSRTTLTSLTTFFVVLTLLIFGGEIIYSFSFTLLVGVIVGTYSSIFIASPTLLWFKFSVSKYRNALAEKEKREKERERMRNMYENGVV